MNVILCLLEALLKKCIIFRQRKLDLLLVVVEVLDVVTVVGVVGVVRVVVVVFPNLAKSVCKEKKYYIT